MKQTIEELRENIINDARQMIKEIDYSDDIELALELLEHITENITELGELLK